MCIRDSCITIGTGLGGALMQKGQLYEGAHFHAGEIGYMRYRPDGSCLEQGYSARALMQKASETLGQAALTPNAFFDLVVEKDPDAVRIYHEWIDGLAQSLADILLITDPEKLVIGGGITERGPLLLKPLKRAIQARLPQEMAEHFSVELAQCGNSAGTVSYTHLDVYKRQQQMEAWFARYADPAMDGRHERVSGNGQLDRAGLYAEGRQNYEPLGYEMKLDV